MEAYTSTSSSSAYKKASTKNSYNDQLSTLRSVRKSPLKTMMKKPIAPMPPTRPKVYKVDPVNFRDLVQKLTGAASSDLLQPQRLKSVAPPPINVSGRSSGDDHDHDRAVSLRQLLQLPSPAKTPFSALYKELMGEMSDEKPHHKLSDCGTTMAASDSLGLSLSPSSYNWCSYPLLSPASFSQLGA